MTATMNAPAHVPANLVAHFDFRHGAGMEDDPWAEFAKLNQGPEIFYSLDQGGYWAVTRKALIEEILSMPEAFSSAFNSIPRMESDFRLMPPNLDPPEHAKYRKIITQRIFNISQVDGIETDARNFLRGLLDQFSPSGEGDFMAGIARPFPIAVFLKLMGMPRDRLAEFSQLIDVFFRGEDVDKVGAARMAVFKFAQDWLNGDPSGDDALILRELKAAEVDGKPLTGEILSVMVLTLIFAGLDTVSSQIAFIVHFLSTHPAHLERLVKDPAIIPNAVEELLRRFGIANLCRSVVSDIEFHGVTMKKGDLVMVSSTMAGVDEAGCADAMTVDFDRPNVKRHAAFGKGIHHCAGERLARIELRVLLEEMVLRLRNLRLKPKAKIQFLPGTIMSLRSLPVVWEDATQK